uniref:Poly [ADP-ribose] polymerase n=1 Tax=Panagrellus redivivus TaxID=6233 RepID=A0A7E4VHP3_PANRE
MFSTVWEYHHSRKRWIRYNADISAQLNAKATEAPSQPFQMDIDNCSITFDFVNMKARNAVTKFPMEIRCAVLDSDSQYAIWEYLATRHKWTSFDPAAIVQLEKLKALPLFDIRFKDQKATISVENGRMLYGEDDQNETKIRRSISDAAPAIAGNPVVSESVRANVVTRASKRNLVVTDTVKTKVVDEVVVEKKSKLETKLLSTAEGQSESPLEAAVDDFVEDRTSKEVYIEGSDVYSVMLNQTNSAQNNNKYFLIQLLKHRKTDHYFTFFRWGRVGFNGQKNLIDCGDDLEKAKTVFCNKFVDKTNNEFSERHNFVKCKGKYALIEMDFSKKTEPRSLTEETTVESKLPSAVQELLKLICDMKKMEEAARNLDYDSTRAPLGKLTKAQIKAGYEALTKIEDCIFIEKFNKEFKDAVDEYYTNIPHYFGMRQPTPIRTLDELKRELELLEMLTEIEAAVSNMNEVVAEAAPEKKNVLDDIYGRLKCDLEPLDTDSERYQLISSYLFKTHAPNHDSYTMQLKSVFAVDKHGESERFKADLGNRMLLWHGSRLTNWHGILTRGLCVAPKEAPVTGHMFGKGVYFADMSSKSANYCYPKHGERGILVLSEVALGEVNPKFKADNRASNLPEGKSAVKGVGDIGPNPEEFVTLDDGVIVPVGTQIDQPEAEAVPDNDLLFNEYVVYDTAQIRMRYLVEVEFCNVKTAAKKAKQAP